MATKYIEIKFTEWIPWGSHLTVKYPTKNRKYIKSLMACRTFATLKDIYPEVANPLTHEMHTLWKLGYVKKYTKPGLKNRSWYKITSKGKQLLTSLGL